MIIPGLSTLKTWGLAILGVGAAVLFALLRNEQAKRAKEKVDLMKENNRVQQKASKATIDGLQREEKAKNEDVDPDDIDRFY
jgi:hypothetical protein